MSGPRLADVLVGCEALEGLEPAGEVIRRDEIGEMAAKLVVALVVKALDGGVLDGAVHPFDLTVGPRVPGLGGPVFDVVCGAGIFESMRPEALAICDGLLDEGNGRPSCTRRGELDAIVGEHGMDLVGDGSDQAQQEVSGDGGGGLCSSTKANFEVRPIATNICSLPCSVRTSATSMWKEPIG